MANDKIGRHVHVVGGQFGSEGKGRVVQALCEEVHWDVAVRIGGPQAGHTFYHRGEKFVFKQIPIPAMFGSVAVIGRSAVVDLSLLEKELKTIKAHLGHDPVVLVDPRAIVLEDRHKQAEVTDGLEESIGSTTTGVGAARAEHIMRRAVLVGDVRHVHPKVVVTDTAHFLNRALIASQRVMFEGTQGLGLGLSHSGHYPYVTSADLTPLQILASTGVRLQTFSHREPPQVIGVFRTFPIRVGGHSGPVHQETDWDALRHELNSSIPTEITTVTQRIRRVGGWDAGLARQSVREGSITHAVYTFLDYLGDSFDQHRRWIQAREIELGIPTLGFSTSSGKERGGFSWATT